MMPVVYDPVELASWADGVWQTTPDGAIRGVSNDTRTLAEGNMYIAIRGENFDGHRFVGKAFEQGASAALVERGFADVAKSAGPLLVVEDGLRALQKLASGYRRKQDACIIGVTGSVGKSTVKEMTAAMVGVRRRAAKTRANWNNDIGLPLSLLAMDADTDVGVFELGMNHPGEIEALCEILQPTHAIVTAIGPVHIEFFESVADIAAEKAMLPAALPATGKAVLWQDDPYYNVLRKAAGDRGVTVSGEAPADYVYAMTSTPGVMQIDDRDTGECVAIEHDLPPGEHHILNAALAAAGARVAGASWEEIASGLRAYRPMPMRWEEHDEKGIIFVNDAYNANPLSMRASIGAFNARFDARQRWLVLGGMLELGESTEREHLALGRFASKGGISGLIAIGQPGGMIADGARSAGLDPDRVHCCASAEEAAAVLHERLSPSACVLLKGSRSVAVEKVLSCYRGGNDEGR